MREKRVALVTGAGSGIGRATAGRLSDEGFHVVLTGRGAGLTLVPSGISRPLRADSTASSPVAARGASATPTDDR